VRGQGGKLHLQCWTWHRGVFFYCLRKARVLVRANVSVY
jgi:rhamnogalacturonyl hydrolase YesR